MVPRRQHTFGHRLGLAAVIATQQGDEGPAVRSLLHQRRRPVLAAIVYNDQLAGVLLAREVVGYLLKGAASYVVLLVVGRNNDREE